MGDARGDVALVEIGDGDHQRQQHDPIAGGPAQGAGERIVEVGGGARGDAFKRAEEQAPDDPGCA